MLWKILLGILLFLILLLWIPLRVSVRYTTDGTFRFLFRAAGIPLFRWPKPKQPFRPRHYSPAAVARRERKELKKRKKIHARAEREKKKKKKSTAATTSPPSQEKPSLSSQIGGLASLITDAVRRTLGHVRFDVRRLSVTVATSDAAKTALLYGAISSSVAFLLEALNQSSHLHFHGSGPYGVGADFSGTQTQVDIQLSATIRIWHLVDIGCHALIHFLRLQTQKRGSQGKNPKKSVSKQASRSN